MNNPTEVDRIIETAGQRSVAEPWVDALSHVAGPDCAIVVDGEGALVNVVPWDHERGAPLEQVPASGFVS